ncbi:MAG: hypothetical protein A2Y34_15015 [Spirochaetes bacterium GWC1_27_15]|nr:MAG: hypothetical protein A2Z98_05935 [Spirochaetes bacterium GWB1_27_13]OHD25190.1 MAG: hypothetical protein A2Y34_15015 [Spirochaetes bacterium GWC1_27_15]
MINILQKIKYFFIKIITFIIEFTKSLRKKFFVKKDKVVIEDIPKKKNTKNFPIKKFLFPLTLYRMLFREFLNWFLLAQGLFIIILLIIDLFQKINDYTNSSASILNIVYITVLFMPKSISFTIPIAVMFGTTMTLGTFYQHNELVAIYTIGVSLMKFTVPIILFNVLLSGAMILIDSNVVIPTERYRLDFFERVTKKSNAEKLDNENITIRGEKNFFWNVGKFYANNSSIQNVIVFRINDDYKVIYRIDALKALYTAKGWLFYAGVIREWDNEGNLKSETKFQKRVIQIEEKPTVFKKSRYEVENMTIEETKERIALLKRLQIEHNKELTGYYKKYSFPFTLLMVALFAIGVATVSRTNVMILALFFSVGLAVLVYVMQIILDVLASTGKIPPIVGAWLPLIIFIPIGIVLINRAKT